jgi:hypothetical protein
VVIYPPLKQAQVILPSNDTGQIAVEFQVKFGYLPIFQFFPMVVHVSLKGESRKFTIKVRKFRGYKLSQMLRILDNFSYVVGHFLCFFDRCFENPHGVRFGGYKLLAVAKKLTKLRNFLPLN